MPRKLAALAALAALLLLGAGPASAPVSPTLQRCPGADLSPIAGPAGPDPVGELFRARRETRAVLVLVDGCPALKAYGPGYSDANRFISWSMAKTVTAMLVGALVGDGRLTLDAPAPVAEWHRRGDPRAAITLRMLLQMRSGLRHTEVGDPVENSDTNQVLFVRRTGDMAAAAIAQPLESRPGTRFEYSSLTTIILAEIVTRALTPSHDPRVRALTYRRFAEQRLFAPAGVRSAALEFDGAGTQIGGSLMHFTLGDMGRLGLLLLDGKGVGGRQVVAPAWLAFMKTPSPTNSEYGGHVWLNRPGGVDRSAKLFPQASERVTSMRGHLGQLIVADPDGGTGRGTVVVRVGHTDERLLGPIDRTVGEIVAGLERR